MRNGICWGLLLCCVMPESSAYVYDVRVIKRALPGNGGYQHLIGLSDFHDRNQVDVARKQRLMFELLAKECDTSASKFLVEDLSSPNSDGAYSCARYHANTRGGFLGGIAATLQHHGCLVDNLEFRYCRVVALGLVAAGNNNARARLMQEIISMKEFVQETANMAKKVAMYNDRGMQPLFRQWRASLEPKFSALQRYAHMGISVRDYVKRFEHLGQGDKEIESLLSYDSPLLDVRLVHEVLNDMYHKVLVVVTGGTHIRNAFDVLEKNGYTRVPVTQEPLEIEARPSSTAIDARSSRAKGIVPRPVSLLSSAPFWPKKGSR